MAEKQVEVYTTQIFSDDDYGWVDAHTFKTVRADVAERWVAEDKAKLVPVEKRAVVETPEDGVSEHETADLRRKKK